MQLACNRYLKEIDNRSLTVLFAQSELCGGVETREHLDLVGTRYDGDIYWCNNSDNVYQWSEDKSCWLLISDGTV